MPTKPKHPCNYAGCTQMVQGKRYCDEHEKKTVKDYERRRGTARERGYDSRWDKARRYYLKRHPLCVICLANDKTTAANEVDHIIPHKGDKELFWDSGNWQALCKSCHSKKTAKEDGRWG